MRKKKHSIISVNTGLEDTDADIVDRVRSTLLNTSLEKRPALDSLAKRLGVSTRSLQRSISKHGVTYTELLTETRKSLAFELLHNSQLSISEISYLLGFSEISVLSRKYRTWYGRCPRDDRKAKV
jgi:AraC-like DNA-binding protein